MALSFFPIGSQGIKGATLAKFGSPGNAANLTSPANPFNFTSLQVTLEISNLRSSRQSKNRHQVNKSCSIPVCLLRISQTTATKLTKSNSFKKNISTTRHISKFLKTALYRHRVNINISVTPKLRGAHLIYIRHLDSGPYVLLARKQFKGKILHSLFPLDNVNSSTSL